MCATKFLYELESDQTVCQIIHIDHMEGVGGCTFASFKVTKECTRIFTCITFVVG